MTRAWRIAMLVLNTVGRGTYWRAFHFARHLAARGHAVTLVATPRRRPGSFRQYMEAGVMIVEIPDLLWGSLRSGWDPVAAVLRTLWLRRQPFDLVHAFEARPTVLLPALAQRQRGIPLLMDWGDWFGRGGSVEERPNPLVRGVLRPVETFFEERFRTRADGTVVICSTLREKAIGLGVPPDRILLLRDGADPETIRPLDPQVCRRQHGLPSRAPIIGYVGMIFQRDAKLMAEAFNGVRMHLPEARLLLIGYFNRRVEGLVADAAAVIRTGEIAYVQLSSFLGACDVCWLPFRNSGANRGRWPLKLTDYMAASRPTVATAVGDVTAFLQQHAAGVLADCTAEDVAAKTVALLQNEAERKRLGQSARRCVEGLDWRYQTDQLEQFYGQVLAHCAPQPAG